MNHKTGSYLICKWCGKQFYVQRCRLKRKGKRAPKYCNESCKGHVAAVKHGHSRQGARTPTYLAWKGMNARTSSTADPRHKRLYYDRGIRVCKRWAKYENFLVDMGEKPKGKSLERRNNNRGYSPSNCYWATQKEQNRNKVNSRLITYAGRTQCVTAWADEVGLKEATIRRRLNSGWTTKMALTVSAQSAGSRNANWRGDSLVEMREV